ncbi:MAG: AAA family ATPase [Isosphaeraceae bacterium]
MNRVTIKELRLRNYRAFADARLVLDDVTFLVGRNGAGKSTLMDAFSFVSEAVTDSLGTALERRGNLEGILRKQPRRGPRSSISVAVRFELQELDQTFPVLYGFTVGTEGARSNFIVKEEVFQVGNIHHFEIDKHSFNRNERGFQAIERSIQPALDSETLVLPLIGGIPGHWKSVVETLRNISIQQLSPRAIRGEPPIGGHEGLGRDGHNAGDVLKSLRSADRDWINCHLAAAVPGIRSVQPTTRAGRRVIVFEQEGEGGQANQFDAWMMSDGTLRSLGILLALRQSPRPSIVLLDEIEDSLHPHAHGVLLEAIDEVSDEFPVVVSTHSPEILDHPTARGERIRVIQWNEGTSQIYTLGQRVLDNLKPPLTVGRLLRSNALWTASEPSTTGTEDDFFKP